MSGDIEKIKASLPPTIDPSKVDVYITHVYLGLPDPGMMTPLVWISRVKENYMQGLDPFFGALTKEGISDMVEDGSVLALEQEVKLLPGKAVWADQGVYDSSRPNEIKVHVWLTNNDNPFLDENKMLIASYTISEHIDIRKK